MENKEQKSPASGAGQNLYTSEGVTNTAKVAQNVDIHKENAENIPDAVRAIVSPFSYNEIQQANLGWMDRLHAVLNYAQTKGIIDELPVWGLPAHLQHYLQHVTDVYQCPREFPTVALFSAISTAAGTKVKISGKHDNSLCLWFVAVNPTGGSKSQPTKEVLRPIEKIKTEQRREYNEALKTAGEGDERPKLQRIIFKDATREARATMMSNFPHGSLLYRDEFSGLFKDFARYSANSGEREELLSIFDGNESIQVDRKGSEPIDVERPFLNILGGIQPDILTGAFGDTDVASGLFGRFLFAWPDEPLFPDYKSVVIDKSYRDHWADVINYIFYEMSPVTLFMPAQTTQVYADYYNLLQGRKRELSEGDKEGAIYSKAQIQVIRLAGIIHTAKLAYDIDAGTAIGADTMAYAVECMEYFVRCGEKALKRVCGSQHRSSKKEIIKAVFEVYPGANVSMLARAIGISQSKVSAIKNGR